MPDQVLQNDECSSKGRKDGKEGETKSGGKEGGGRLQDQTKSGHDELKRNNYASSACVSTHQEAVGDTVTGLRRSPRLEGKGTSGSLTV